MGHIINLTAKAFLFSDDPDLFEEKVAGTESLMKKEQVCAAQAEWRRKRALGKLRNIRPCILLSPQRKCGKRRQARYVHGYTHALSLSLSDTGSPNDNQSISFVVRIPSANLHRLLEFPIRFL